MRIAWVLLLGVSCAHGRTQASAPISPWRPTLAQMVRSLPDDSDTLMAFDVRQLRASPALRRLWTIVTSIPALRDELGTPCVGSLVGFSYDAELVLLGGVGGSPRGQLGWIVGVDRDSYDKCRDRLDNKQELARMQITEYVEGDMVTQQGTDRLQQFLWVAPQLVIALANRTEAQPGLESELRAVASRAANKRAGGGMLARPAMRALFDRVDRTASVWAISDSPRIERDAHGARGVAFSLRMSSRLDVALRLVTESPAVAERLSTKVRAFGAQWAAGMVDRFVVTTAGPDVSMQIGAGPRELERIAAFAEAKLDVILKSPAP